MKKTKNKQQKPKWFKGMWYNKGEVVTNPYSGEEYELTGPELSMYDFIKGAEFTIATQFNDDILHPDTSKLQNDLYKAIDWFRSENPEAYMVLLD
jgi:hypothetical protein